MNIMKSRNSPRRSTQAQTPRMPDFAARRRTVIILFTIGFAALGARALQQHILNNDFLQRQGEERYLRVHEIAAQRGEITDHEGETLALSAPVDSLWADPQIMLQSKGDLAPLAHALGAKPKEFKQRIQDRADKNFMYLERGMPPSRAAEIMRILRESDIKGADLHREYRRFYPNAEVTAHVVGFTNIDEHGLEGLEAAYDQWLRPSLGAKRVIRDGRGRIVEEVESIRLPEDGRKLILSLDLRLQYLAYRALKNAVQKHQALGGSAVILDVATGEVRAMVNQPSYNPNDTQSRTSSMLKNRALTDVMEPGSTIKPFVVAAALERKLVKPETEFDTSPGQMKVGRATVKDVHNYGRIDVTRIIAKSSNVGVTMISQKMQPRELWSYYDALGLGQSTHIGFPGEASGFLPAPQGWSAFEQATLSFGYGLSATPLQMARAYSVLAARGVLRPVSFFRQQGGIEEKRVFKPEICDQVMTMMEQVVAQGGTATKAAVPGYRVAGKTGTSKKNTAHGYSDDRYLALFVGIVPVTNPQLVMAVVVDEPKVDGYYGGQVAAPVFNEVMTHALRLLNVPPDASPAQAAPLTAARTGQ